MKIECDELLVICDNCGHAIHVKELDNNLIKLNNKNDKLISEQDAINALIEWYGCEPNDMDYFKEILAKKSSAQSVDKNINVPINDTISRQAAIDDIKAMYEWHDVVTEDRLIEHMKRLPSAQPELIERTAYIRRFEQGRTQGMIDSQGGKNMIKAEWTNADALQPTCNQLATDCISRQAAIDLCDWYDNPSMHDDLEKLPSAQPERDIPMKPNETIDSSWGVRKKQAVCPKCDAFLNHIEFIGDQVKPTYCEFCGQAINWEGWEWEE